MPQQPDSAALQTAKDALEYADLSAEFGDLAQTRYDKVVYLCFRGCNSVDQLLSNMKTVLGSFTEPNILLNDVLFYQDVYSITHSYSQILEVERMIRRQRHHQIVMINPTSKFIATIIQKTSRITGISVDMVFKSNPTQALATAKVQVSKVIKENIQQAARE